MTSNPVGRNSQAGTYWGAPQRDGTLITDMTRCEPRAAISSRLRKASWYSMPYQTRDGIEGVMVGVGELTHPPDLTMPLEAKGWHAVYIGVFEGGAGDAGSPDSRFALRVKLTGDEYFETVRPGALSGGDSGIEEFFWRAADLDGRGIVFSQSPCEHLTTAHVAFVRIVPMSEDEVTDYRGATGTPDTRVLVMEVDGQGPFLEGARTIEDLLEIYEAVRDTDVGKLFLGTGGIGPGSTYYPTKVGHMIGDGDEAFYNEMGRRSTESLLSYVGRGIDPVKVRVEHAQAMGLEVYLGFRMGTTAMVPPTWLELVPFWREHPEWRCRDRDGVTIPRLSMAYPEVRKFYVDLLLELADYGVEGVQLIYTRRAPFALFEPPVIEDFKSKYGVDPRELIAEPGTRGEGDQPDVAPHPGAVGVELGQDERLETHRAGYVTTFMRELRSALDQKRRPDGGRLHVVANVLHNSTYNRSAALDLETWAAEGLVDILVPASDDRGSRRVDPDYFRKIIQGTSCVFYEDILPRQMPPGEYVKRARDAYEGGAAGLSFWDTEGRITIKSQWNTIRRLGHREDLDRMAIDAVGYLMHPLKQLEDWNPTGFM